MPGIPIKGFIGPAYMSVSRAINAQRCVNLRLEIDGSNGKVPVALVGLPGYRSVVSDLPAGEVRGFWKTQDRAFAVVGDTLHELFSDMTHQVRGTLGTTTGRVSMTDNGIHLMMVDGSGVLALKFDSNVTTTVIDNFPYGARFIVCIDSTLVANDPNSQRFQISAVGDALTWNALDFTSAEGMPDDLVAIVAFNRQLYLLGSGSLQVFWNSGISAQSPFSPVDGSAVEVGCAAPYSAVKDESGVYWLGQDPRGGPRVYKATGGSAGVISTPALDNELRGYSLGDALGYTFRENGHIFYVLIFPAQGRTWVFDATAEAWQEFLEWTDGEWRRHRSNCAIYAFGKQLIGDFENGRIYEMSPDIYENDGAPLRALRASSHVSQNQDPIVVGSLEVVIEPGVGLTTGQGSDPQMMLRTSKTSGATWTPERIRPMGKRGEYGMRTRWNRPCGSPRDIVWEVSITDPVKRAIMEAVLNGI